jgi:hypothetical protein
MERIRSSSVGIETGYGLDNPGSGVRFPAGAGNVFLLHRVQTGSGAHQASCLMGTGALSPVLKRPGRDSDQSPPPSAEVENTWRYTSTSIRLHGVVLSLAQG